LQGEFYVLNADGNERDSSQTSDRLGPLTCICERDSQKTHSSNTKRALWPWWQCGSPSLVPLAGDHCYSQQIRA